MEFIIDRSKWRCGSTNSKNSKGLGETKLLNNEGYMCCLGQISKQLGCSDESILFIETPYSIDDKDRDKIRNVLLNYHGNSDLAYEAISINDSKSTTIRQKESSLKELFKKYGHSIKFIGKSVKYKEV